MIRRDRNWVILRNAHDNVWVQVTAMVAPTAKQAVDRATRGASNPYPHGRFLAVPSSVWGKQVVK